MDRNSDDGGASLVLVDSASSAGDSESSGGDHRNDIIVGRGPNPDAHPPRELDGGCQQRAVGRNEEDLRQYKSCEARARLPRDKFLEVTHRGHSWSCVRIIEVDDIVPGMTVHAFLRPGVSEGGERKAFLDVTAEMSCRLLGKLNEGRDHMWVVVESEVADQHDGRIYGVREFVRQKIDSGTGSVAFSQELLRCEEVRECRGGCLDVVLKATFLIHQQNEYVCHNVEDEYYEVRPIVVGRGPNPDAPPPRELDGGGEMRGIGRNDEDLRKYKSREARERLHKDKLLEVTRRGHSWSRVMIIEVDNVLRGVTVRVFLRPGVSEGGVSKAILDVTAEVSRGLLARLNECRDHMWVVVESEVADQRDGRIYGVREFVGQEWQEINSRTGTVAFSQELLRCKEVRECRARCLDVVLKATFLTRQQNDYVCQDRENNYCEVRHRDQ